jgi:prephenate dehydrogenase
MKTLSIIGVGAFGEFMIRHLAPFFRVLVHDPDRDLAAVEASYNVTLRSLEACAAADVVVLAVPVQAMEAVAGAIAPHLSPGALVLDVASVKVRPAELLDRLLPAHVDIVCTHPLFGPQSGGRGIAGLKVTVCNVRGARDDCVVRFLEERLMLEVIRAEPETHDRELAYVQGLTHLIGKILIDLDLSGIRQTTRSFDLVMQAVDFIRDDSEELFRAIERENPYVSEAHLRFFEAARQLEKALAGTRPGKARK